MEVNLLENPFEHNHEDSRCVHELLQSIDFGLFLVVERLEALLGDESAKERVLKDIEDRNNDEG